MSDIVRSVPDGLSSATPIEPVPVSALSGDDPSRCEPTNMDRPSSHGAALGRFLAAMVRQGGGAEMCATCAFREGTLANQSAATGLTAMHCAMGTDPAAFACHHGMKDGEPTKLCAGALAAKCAPFEAWKAGISEMAKSLPGDDANDPIRKAFDQWRDEIDPEARMDVYQLGRAYARRDSDGNPKGGDGTAPSQSDDSADPKGIAQRSVAL